MKKSSTPEIRLYQAVASGMKASCSLVQFHSGVLDFFVLTATASYCDVARYCLAKHSCVIKYSTYQYICWQYVQVHTGMYQNMQVHTKNVPLHCSTS